MKDNIRSIEEGYSFISEPYRVYKNACEKYEEFVDVNDTFSPIRDDVHFKYLIQDINRRSRIAKDDCKNISIYIKI